MVDGANFVSGATIAAVELSWQISGTADFNGDLKADLLWQNATTGDVAVWTMDGDTFLSGSTVFTSPKPTSGWEMPAAATSTAISGPIS